MPIMDAAVAAAAVQAHPRPPVLAADLPGVLREVLLGEVDDRLGECHADCCLPVDRSGALHRTVQRLPRGRVDLAVLDWGAAPHVDLEGCDGRFGRGAEVPVYGAAEVVQVEPLLEVPNVSSPAPLPQHAPMVTRGSPQRLW